MTVTFSGTHKQFINTQNFIEKYRKFIPSEEKKQAIANCESIYDLQREMRAGKFGSVDLLMFYIDRCVQYALPLNILAEPNFEKAYQKAQECDRILSNPEEFERVISGCDYDGVII